VTETTQSSMRQILLLPLVEALNHSSHGHAIESITSDSYANPGVLLEQEFIKNNEVYLSISENGQLDAFFMVGWSTLQFLDQQIECVFLGLSAARSEHKGTRLVPCLYSRFFRDAESRAQNTGRPVAWWFHTASPIVAGLMWRLANDIGPSPDGIISDQQMQLLTAIQDKYNFLRYRDESVPYVLRKVAKARYVPSETARLTSRSERRPSLLDQLQVREDYGDRMLFVGRCCPPA
jgi:hypothetical protein